MQNAVAKLRSHGIHPSVQRIAIMDYVMKHLTHPTVDDVYVALSQSMPTLSKTTVYNTLRLFAECGAVRMLTIDERKLCFDGCVEPHAHFICRQCGRLMDVPLSEEARRLTVPHEETDCRIEETHLYYKGVCRKCLKKEQQNN
ncbi:MAG: transcriptional repressor [Paraprevotella sp.]|nr:transcriptional repressor [Paraprevotella sp.]